MKYLIPDSDRNLFVTHEINYRNLKIYSAGQQLVHLTDQNALQDGHTIQSEDLGEIDLILSNKKTLEIRVNGLLCTRENPISLSEDNLIGLSRLFLTVAVLSTIGIVIQFYSLSQIGFNVLDIVSALLFTILATAVYYLATIFTKQGKAWAYFVGTGTFLIMSLIYTINIFTSFLPDNLLIAFYVFLVFRLGILIILLYYFKSVIRVMNNPKKSGADQDILDDFQT